MGSENVSWQQLQTVRRLPREKAKIQDFEVIRLP